jgi:hypothetical protein
MYMAHGMVDEKKYFISLVLELPPTSNGMDVSVSLENV